MNLFIRLSKLTEFDSICLSFVPVFLSVLSFLNYFIDFLITLLFKLNFSPERLEKKDKVQFGLKLARNKLTSERNLLLYHFGIFYCFTRLLHKKNDNISSDSMFEPSKNLLD